MVGGGTYFEINLQREQRINELKTLYTIDELINHCYEEEQEIERLNNIIDELEKNLNISLQTEQAWDEYCYGYNDCLKDMLNKLNELKQEN